MSERHHRRRATLGALALLAGLAGAWHASPVALWHGRFAAQLARESDASRLHSETWSALPRPAVDWPELRSGALSLRAPLSREALPACGRCGTACRLPLDNRGTLALFDELPPASHDEIFDQFAPDAGDISLLRSVGRNWRTIDALTDRVRARSTPPHSFRFEAPGSRGVVTEFLVDGVTRYVVYAYSPDGLPARLIGVAGLERERFEGLLGGLRIAPEGAGESATCTAPEGFAWRSR